jgi:hypothetical protein
MKFTRDDCDCTSTELGYLEDVWYWVCIALGLLGFFVAFLFTGIPALFSALKYNSCLGFTACCKTTNHRSPGSCCANNAVCYGVSAGIFSPMFLMMGVFFVSIGALAVDETTEACKSEAKMQANSQVPILFRSEGVRNGRQIQEGRGSMQT